MHIRPIRYSLMVLTYIIQSGKLPSKHYCQIKFTAPVFTSVWFPLLHVRYSNVILWIIGVALMWRVQCPHCGLHTRIIKCVRRSWTWIRYHWAWGKNARRLSWSRASRWLPSVARAFISRFPRSQDASVAFLSYRKLPVETLKAHGARIGSHYLP